MEKIIPFKKDIPFKTNIYEINSISLEHTLSLKDEYLIMGDFIISGTYKLTSSSINIDEFNFKIPFEISIDKKYDTKNIKVDINDFYYEVIDNSILSVSIEVLVNNLEEKEEIMESARENKIIDIEEVNTKEPDELERDFINNDSLPQNKEIISSIFDNLDDNENYVTYKVHIVTENDTVESILQKYEISSNKLELYNDMSSLKIGDKLIIPTNDQNK